MAQCSRVVFVAALAAWLGSSQRALAQEQITILDATYTATSANTSDSHYRVPPANGTPSDWRSPNDYAAGRAHVRLEVIEKPSDAQTLYNVCFEATPTYACLPYSPQYTAPGVYDFEYPFSAFYQGDQVDWSHGTSQIALILKDHDQVKRQGDPNFYPTKIHVTISLMTSGTAYVPPSEDPAVEEPVDAGHDAAESDDASDPGLEPDAGEAMPGETPPDVPAAGAVAPPLGGASGAAGGSSAGAGGASGAGVGGAPSAGAGGVGGTMTPVAGSISEPMRSTKDDDVVCSIARMHGVRNDAGSGLAWLALGAPWLARGRRRRPRAPDRAATDR